MRKILLGTSAVLLFLSSVEAAPVKLSVGGYSKLYTGYVDGDSTFNDIYGGTYNHVPVSAYIELAFKGETALENGVKFGANIELEGITRDENDINKRQSYIYMDTAFGRIKAGNMDTLSQQFHKAAKDVGIIEIEATDVGMLVPNGMDYVSTDIRQNGADSTTISYISPKLSGITFAMSYSDMGKDSTHNFEGNDAAYAGVLAFDHSFDALKVSADIGYTHFDSYYPYDDVISAGLRFEYNGFTFGGGYKHGNSGIPVLGDTNTFDVGIAYENGFRYGVSLSYISEATENVRNMRDATKQMLLGSVSFGIAPGIKTSLSAAYINDKDYSHDFDAYLLATGLLVAF